MTDAKTHEKVTVYHYELRRIAFSKLTPAQLEQFFAYSRYVNIGRGYCYDLEEDSVKQYADHNIRKLAIPYPTDDVECSRAMALGKASPIQLKMYENPRVVEEVFQNFQGKVLLTNKRNMSKLYPAGTLIATAIADMLASAGTPDPIFAFDAYTLEPVPYEASYQLC